MTAWRTGCHVVFWFALALWFGVLLAAGIAAVFAFTTLPDLSMTLHDYPGVEQSDHGTIAAGIMMERVFTLVDAVQICAAALVILGVILQSTIFRVPRRRLAVVVQVLGIAVAVGSLGYRAAMITPSMNADLRAAWTAAQADDVETAAAHRAAFDQMHPTAARLMNITLGGVLVALLASAAVAAPTTRPESPPLPDLS